MQDEEQAGDRLRAGDRAQASRQPGGQLLHRKLLPTSPSPRAAGHRDRPARAAAESAAWGRCGRATPDGQRPDALATRREDAAFAACAAPLKSWPTPRWDSPSSARPAARHRPPWRRWPRLDDAGAQRDLSRVQECWRDSAASEEALELGGEWRRDVSTDCVRIEEDARVAPHEGVQVSGVAPGQLHQQLVRHEPGTV